MRDDFLNEPLRLLAAEPLPEISPAIIVETWHRIDRQTVSKANGPPVWFTSKREELDLSSVQRTAFEVIERQFALDWINLEEELHMANRQLVAALPRHGLFSPDVANATAQISRIQDELRTVTLQHVAAIRPHLSSEQYHRLIEMYAKMLDQR